MKALARRLLTLDAVSLVLTFTAMACMPIALRITAPDAALTLLLPLMIIGVLAGSLLWRMWRFKLPLRFAFVLTGVLLIYLRVGQLGAVLVAARDTLSLVAGLLLPTGSIPIQLGLSAQWVATQSQAWTDALAFSQRAITWLANILQGNAVNDPAPRALFLAIGIWLLSIWASWRTVAQRDVLGGLLPVTAAVALILDLTAQNRWPLWLHLGALLLLLGITELSSLTKSWRRVHRDYSDSIPEDSLLAATLLSLLVLTAAFAVSSFSLKEFIDRFRQPPPAAGSASSSSSGRSSSGGSARIGTLGLQGSHFIGAGPSLTQDVVMIISTDELPPMQPAVDIVVPRYYWRAETFEHYSGRGWHNPIRHDVQLPAEAALIPSEASGYRIVHANVDVLGGLAGAAYWTGTLVDIDTALDLAWRPVPGLAATLPLAESPRDVDLIGGVLTPDVQTSVPPDATAYHFTALVAQPSEDQLRAAPISYPEWVLERYTQLPSTLPDRVRALARDLTARGQTPYDRAAAIESYLRTIPYSLDVPAAPSESDATDFFIFDLKRGYCDYYATAMTVLARAAGLPARFVTGYASGSYEPLSAEYLIRQADAHAWTEIYFTGIGWIEFEPTSSQPLPRRVGQASPASASEAGTRPAVRKTILPTLDASRLRLALWAVPVFGMLSFAWLLLDGLRLRRMSPDAAAQAVYHRMRRGTRRALGPSSIDETALEYARALSARLSSLGFESPAAVGFLEGVSSSVSDLTRLYLLSTFAPAPLGASDGHRALRAWDRLRWRLLALDLILLLSRRSSLGRRPKGPDA